MNSLKGEKVEYLLEHLIRVLRWTSALREIAVIYENSVR